MQETTHPQGSTAAPISIVLVEHQALLLAGFVALCESLPGVQVIGTAPSGSAGSALIQERSPRMALIELFPGDLDGIAIALCLREKDIQTRVILLAESAEPEWFQKAQAAGVPGYLLRRSSAGELEMAVERLAEGGLYYTSAMHGHLLSSGPQVKNFGNAALSGEQQLVLQLVANGRSSGEIALMLGCETRHVQYVRQQLMDMFGVSNVAALVSYAYEHRSVLIRSNGSEPSARASGDLTAANP